MASPYVQKRNTNNNKVYIQHTKLAIATTIRYDGATTTPTTTLLSVCVCCGVLCWLCVHTALFDLYVLASHTAPLVLGSHAHN